jgi:molybdopterin converting factor small subunit
MALVHLNLEQRRFTDGAAEVEVEAGNVKQLIAKLEERYSGIGAILAESAVAINGEIINDPAYQPVPAGAEIYFVAKAAGG